MSKQHKIRSFNDRDKSKEHKMKGFKNNLKKSNNKHKHDILQVTGRWLTMVCLKQERLGLTSTIKKKVLKPHSLHRKQHRLHRKLHRKQNRLHRKLQAAQHSKIL
jgi:hypothetical protein